tara:strand:- start:3 stop:284 length:282 start_codon:yes stop_codon:yes gene_type:complete
MYRNILDKVEQSYSENKKGFKTYATCENAVKAIKPQLKEVADMHGLPDDIFYIPVLIPSCGRWTVFVLFSNWMSIHKAGGYALEFSARGFWQV